MGEFRIKRVYEEPESADGLRVLVDRLWPRGVSREQARVDRWDQGISPSVDLFSWFHVDRGKRFPEFAERYAVELCDPDRERLLQQLRGEVVDEDVTLVTSVKDLEHSHVPMILKALKE